MPVLCYWILGDTRWCWVVLSPILNICD